MVKGMRALVGVTRLAFPQRGRTKSHNQRSIIIVCEYERDRINPENGNPYDEFIMCDIIMITAQNILKFQKSVLVLDDLGDKFNSHIK